jgi:FkbH-like protein
MTIREPTDADIDRVIELINRTNQFNLTGSRVTRRQIQDWIVSDEARLLVADAGDRFGSMGTIAALLVARSDDRLEIPVFVLSCRVFGYGMEFAILKEACNLVGEGERLFGPLRVTEHNQPCHDVYRAAGFSSVEGGWELKAAPDASLAVPQWLDVEAHVRPFAS